MESYLLRVYRRDGTRLVGTIEEAIQGHQTTFQSPEDLWCALAVSPAGRKKARRAPSSGAIARKPQTLRRIE